MHKNGFSPRVLTDVLLELIMGKRLPAMGKNEWFLYCMFSHMLIEVTFVSKAFGTNC